MTTDLPLAIYGETEEKTIEQIKNCFVESAVGGALLGDNHYGYSQPVGGVVAYTDHISVSGVGYDIACGNKAVKTSYNIADLGHEFSEGIVAHWMDRIAEEVSFGMGRNSELGLDHPVLDEIANADFEGQRQFADLASKQLGTVGGGNHYVDLFLDEEGWIWIGVHFGSRGFGHKTATGFISVAQGKNFNDTPSDSGMDSAPDLLSINSDSGQAYIAAMDLAGKYAYAGRDVICSTVLEILGAESTFEVHNHHNFAWRETHNGKDVWVIRKGATPAFEGQLGFVGGSMGDISVILEGTQSPNDSDNFCSTVHGAGRVMSRTRAAGKMKKRWTCSNRDCDWFAGFGEHKPDPVECPKCEHTKMSKQWQQVLPGEINFDEVQEEIRGKGIELRGAGADEAPGVYKRLPEVLEAHTGQIKILHTLTPIGVAMAGPDVKDAFRD